MQNFFPLSNKKSLGDHQEGSTGSTNHTSVPPRPTNVATVSENRGVKRARYSSPSVSGAYLDYPGTPLPADNRDHQPTSPSYSEVYSEMFIDS